MSYLHYLFSEEEIDKLFLVSQTLQVIREISVYRAFASARCTHNTIISSREEVRLVMRT